MLGSWKAPTALLMLTSKENYPRWTSSKAVVIEEDHLVNGISCRIAEGNQPEKEMVVKEIEYKYFVKNMKGDIFWERGTINRRIPLSKIKHHFRPGTQLTIVDQGFNMTEVESQIVPK
eukprot:CAMPEP_0170512410 /NCGR_PEP_ID=MMETSP0208-20121228/66833_1 /TAXON_ID=197538 /ORGANISM="Strombidium inclinatum, Strain S3" /LENGTH=117 /DNA_ID=CAMNT_0010796035 /DNA_START=27 /DNA_END=380 /DNA_ORIENTATION=+